MHTLYVFARSRPSPFERLTFSGPLKAWESAALLSHWCEFPHLDVKRTLTWPDIFDWASHFPG